MNRSHRELSIGTILGVGPKNFFGREAAEKIFWSYPQNGTNRKLSVRPAHLWGLLPLLTNILWFISQNHFLWWKQFFFKNFLNFSFFFGLHLCIMPHQPPMTSLWFPNTKQVLYSLYRPFPMHLDTYTCVLGDPELKYQKSDF